ncbi:7-carboxy-7-deazaguanine synthase QueE [Aliarcobacter cryaerophilus]|uniref:7-carboxy-7-deazaguanine synthase n=2 Tax=unclassified Arcobacter TaxID=2593671 RepID=A0AA96CQW5_9BACT|nr:7-carboxy-7-deazaguanine synthase QueE [Arcobacter sp. AZ-2023]WPD09199.1 7-carboxy-7-deazaguanine synthase QueE [Arcobacter sp. DSM 115954]WNL14031.1 7-carboxy-7-deazaguanine synthase QueE [Arcobacter sp. AZ-2023]WNL20088.1 7-carboxy-7-deazaguanine synthase QueE [Arcobacter sp. AZ-2023]WNL22230.1 7-carboxy-7-deazaguanine synthase QueE [Arcobacter sp. AZ-2023]
MLEVNEIFGPTIQGEGKLVGNLSIFIRFGKCNFKCVGFNVEYETPSGVKKCACDSYYAVDMEFKNSWKSYENYLDIVNEVDKLLENCNYKNRVDIVITGGEPLLYWNNQEFQNLIKHYINKNHKLTIETNASLNIDFQEEYQKNILFSMSVKLSNSLESLKKRVNKSTLTKILENTKESYLKFVIGNDFLENAIVEIEDILKNIPQCEVYLMPLGDSSEAININSEKVVNLAIKYGFKYSDRLHIRIWNNKRGV